MRLVRLPMAGAAGRPVIVNAEQVVCVIDVGTTRSQVVTTGLSGEASISLMVELPAAEVADRLEAAVAADPERLAAQLAACVKPELRGAAARAASRA